MNDIVLESEFVTLGQFLKMTDAISSGGMAKWFLQENDVYVNGEIDRRRGRKLHVGDLVNIPGCGRFRLVESKSEE
ncbi:S4 domain-containing protein YaaA [Rummeliibacillus pycnus]|uniref:S4 domain-containing protein YaaA n=1 Tax=Rummeliibacillus pycnus TaxID=101070 RepID=UPI003D2D388E